MKDGQFVRIITGDLWRHKTIEIQGRVINQSLNKVFFQEGRGKVVEIDRAEFLRDFEDITGPTPENHNA